MEGGKQKQKTLVATKLSKTYARTTGTGFVVILVGGLPGDFFCA